MGKYLRSSCKQQQQPSSPAAVASVAAAAVSSYSYLTLRSGRRVPPAAAGGSACRRRHRRGGRRGCAKNGAGSARACGARSPSSSAASGQRRRCEAVECSQGGGRAELSPSPPLGDSGVVVSGDVVSGERNSLKPNSCSGEVAAEHAGELKHNSAAAAAGRRPPLSPPETEIEAFFAAAELAERRRFAETYNYDIALDRPLQGRYEWEPTVPNFDVAKDVTDM
uniref:Cyclin-dependent kinase inhibitor domain-containing protein n=1 Tax=Oryza glumipatula TaxID=40148 RepID=A0A0E0BL64_9ORYZ